MSTLEECERSCPLNVEIDCQYWTFSPKTGRCKHFSSVTWRILADALSQPSPNWPYTTSGPRACGGKISLRDIFGHIEVNLVFHLMCWEARWTGHSMCIFSERLCLTFLTFSASQAGLLVLACELHIKSSCQIQISYFR